MVVIELVAVVGTAILKATERRRHQPGYLNVLGAGHWLVPLAHLRLGKSGFDFLTKPSARSA